MVHDTDSIANGLAFAFHRTAPGLVVAKAQPGLVIGLAAPVEPHCAFPPADLAELRTLCGQPVIDRCLLHRPARGQEAMREGDRILIIIKLDNPALGIVPGRPATEPARVPGGEVPFGLAFGDPFRDRFAGSGRLGNADLNAAGVIEIRQTRGRAADWQRVRRIADGAVDEALYAHLAEKRHMNECLFKHIGDIVHGIREQRVDEIVGNAVLKGETSGMPVRAEQETRPFTSQIEPDVGVADQREQGLVLFKLRNGFGDKILVFERHHRHLASCHPRDLVPVEPGRVDDGFAGDASLACLDGPLAGRGSRYAGHFGKAGNFGAFLARALG